MNIIVGLVLSLAVGLECADYHPLPAPFTEHCVVDDPVTPYPPPDDTKVPWFDIDLDAPPYERWNNVTAVYKDEIIGLIDAIKDFTRPLFHGYLIDFVDQYMGGWDGKMKEPYNEEMKGIADTVGIPLGEIVFYNIFYELNAVCTSIVAREPNGSFVHARNLDFGLFLGWNITEHEWSITQMLRKSIINLNFYRGGKLLFKSTNFAGYIGMFTAMKPHSYSVTMNERYSLFDGGYRSILPFLKGQPTNFVTFFLREVMENATTYTDAINLLETTDIAAPAYFIVGGIQPTEATIITRDRGSVALTTNIAADSFYVLQTNYDQNKTPLYLDDRRAAGNRCMKMLGQARTSVAGIFNVLSSKTSLNKLTAYTSLMKVSTGEMEAYIRECPDPCWPF